MKKLFILFIIITATSLYSNSQGQEIKIGPYPKNGKKLSIQYETRGNNNTLFRSVEYGGVELTKILEERDNLKKERDALKKQEKKLEKRIADLEKADTATARLKKELDSTMNALNNTRATLAEKEHEIARLDSTIQQLNKDLQSAQDRLTDAQKQAYNCARDLAVLIGDELNNKDYINIRTFLTSSTVSNDLTKQSIWNQESSLGQSYQLTYTKYFSRFSLVAITIGAGLERYNFAANIPFLEEHLAGLVDPDGDMIDMDFQYNGITENVSLSYLNVPLELHIGNNTKTKVKGCKLWVDAGLLLSINTGCNFDGAGKYSTYGYYPQWDLTVTDEPLLGLRSNADVYSGQTQWDLNKTILWGTLGVGVNIPISNPHWAINAGAKCAHTLTAVSKEIESTEPTNAQYQLSISNILGGKNTKIFNYGFVLGLTYSL